MNRPGVDLILAESEALHDVALRIQAGALRGPLMTLRCADTIWFTGIGKSGLVALRGASMVRTIGRKASFIDPVAAMHGECGALTGYDAIVAFSHSGETKELLEFLHWQSRIAVVGVCRPKSALAKRSRNVLPVDVEEEIPTVSCAVQNAWIDALVVVLTDNVEGTLQKTHPGGDIGRRLRERIPTDAGEPHQDHGQEQRGT